MKDRFEIPPGQGGAEIFLEIRSPSVLDLDLEVFAVDPDTGFADPICTSDGVGRIESCRVTAPDSRILWWVVTALEGSKPTEFRVSADFISQGDVSLANTELLRWDAPPVSLSDGMEKYRLRMEAGKVCTVVLFGEQRKIEVKGIGQDSALQVNQNRTVDGLYYLSIGQQFGASSLALTGFDEASDLVLSIEPLAQEYKWGNSELQVRGGEGVGGNFLIPFSVNQVQEKPLVLKGKGSNSGEVKEKGLVVYRVISTPEPAVVFLDKKGSADLSLALADKFGRVIEVRDDLVHVRPLRAYPQGKGDNDNAPSMNDDLYLIVLPQPHGIQAGGKFELRFGPAFALERQTK